MNMSPALIAEMAAWRHHIHAHPEVGFEERRTAAFIAEKLRRFGLDEVVEGVGGTGVVGTLRRGGGNRSIGLRADMDALRIEEKRENGHRSKNAGIMHACGHDGHIAMLLGAAKFLAAEGEFSGTLRFIFQPAEEWGRGAMAMLDDGLLERFPIDQIYGIHNWPGLAAGRIATRPGLLMGGEDNFAITVEGQGGHAARPHQSKDALVAACAIVTALQTIVSRSIDPAETAVVSATELETDGIRNVLPSLARIRGDCRSFSIETSRAIEASMRRIVEGIASAHGCTADVSYTCEFVPVVNDTDATAAALKAAEAVFGAENTDGHCAPTGVSEDFARFLERVPGCFLFVGNGADSLPLHNASYDFNDEVLALGARFHVEVARQRLRSP